MVSLLSLFILILPSTLASSSSVEPATPFASLYLILFLMFSACWTMVRGLSPEKLRPLKYPLVLIALLLMITSASSIQHFQGREELFQYTLGLILFLMIAILPENEKKRLVPAIVLGALLISVFAIFQYFFGFDLLREYVMKEKIVDPFVLEKIAQRRVFFPFPTPGILGGYLIMTLPLAFLSKKGRLFSIPLIFALLLTKSLGALLSLTIVATVLGLLHPPISKKKIFVFLALGVILGCVLILRTNNPSQHLLPAFSLTTRIDYWKETWEIIRAHSLTGVGLGNFDLPRSRFAHNFFLQLWAETGFVGIASFLWLITVILKNGWKRLQNPSERTQAMGLIAGICIFLVHNFMDFTFFLPAISFVWWAMMGLLYTPPEDSRSAPSGDPSFEKKLA